MHNYSSEEDEEEGKVSPKPLVKSYGTYGRRRGQNYGSYGPRRGHGYGQQQQGYNRGKRSAPEPVVTYGDAKVDEKEEEEDGDSGSSSSSSSSSESGEDSSSSR